MDNIIEILNLGFVNCYLIKTQNGFILVDTGIAGLRSNLVKKLTQAGCTRENLKLIIITHGDIDHAGNCNYLREEYGAPVAMHKNDLSMVEKAEFDSGRKVKSKLMQFMNLIMKLTGGFKKMVSEFERFTPNILLKNGQSLIEYGIEAEILLIPGHTDGSIAVLFKSGDLICGDTMQQGKSAIIIKDENELNKSMSKLSEFRLTMIYPGHGKPFKWNKKRFK